MTQGALVGAPLFLLYKKLLVSYKVKKIYSARPVAHWMCARAMAIRKLRAEGTIFLPKNADWIRLITHRSTAEICGSDIDTVFVEWYNTILDYYGVADSFLCVPRQMDSVKMEDCMYCYHCMNNKGSESVCPYCHKTHDAPVAAHQLRPGTVLNRKYLVGYVIGEGLADSKPETTINTIEKGEDES